MGNDGSPLAVLDVGSNTIRLLVAHVINEDVEPLTDRSAFARLGRGVDESGRLQEERMAAAIEAIETFAGEAHSLGASTINGIATSAVRDASNGPEFIRRIKAETGVEIEIITGEREAELTFIGATLGVSIAAGAIICDLGGGSAELISAGADGIRWRDSVKLGSGRLTEKFIHHDPPELEDLEALADHVTTVLDGLPKATVESAIFTGGTASHIAHMSGSDDVLTHLDGAKLDEILDVLIKQPSAAVATAYTFQPERTEVLPAGTAAIATIAKYYRASEIVITRRGIREGALIHDRRSASTVHR